MTDLPHFTSREFKLFYYGLRGLLSCRRRPVADDFIARFNHADAAEAVAAVTASDDIAADSAGVISHKSVAFR